MQALEVFNGLLIYIYMYGNILKHTISNKKKSHKTILEVLQLKKTLKLKFSISSVLKSEYYI